MITTGSKSLVVEGADGAPRGVVTLDEFAELEP
jgi:hypothetical protein